MLNLPAEMSSLPGFNDLLSCRKSQALYLVGGALRDWTLGCEIKDIDLATAGDPTSLARDFAIRCGGSWFWLDQQRQQSRVVLKNRQGQFSYDFAPLRAASLLEDLRLRDFTFNSLAVDLAKDNWDLIDPLGARTDLANKCLRQCSPDSFKDDPLRIIRGVRFALQFNLRPDKETLAAMVEQVAQLARIPGERIHAELALILRAENTADILPFWHQLDLTTALFDFSVDVASVESLQGKFQQVELGLCSVQPLLADLSGSVIANGFSRKALLKLYLLLTVSNVNPVASLEQASRRLCLGKRNNLALKGLLDLHGILPCPCQPRAQQLWFEDLPGDPHLSLIYLMLFSSAEGAPNPSCSQLDPNLLRLAPQEKLAPLIAPVKMIAELGFTPGSELGRALAALRREEILERVNTPLEAEAYLLEWKRKTH